MRPFEQGKRAFQLGVLNNPYREDSTEYREWQYGFDRQYFQNLERIKSGRGSKEVYHSKTSAPEKIN
jgi:hypothetical protein